MEGAKKINLGKLEEKLGYSFKDKGLLKKALTHTSFFSQKDKNEANHFQRLEFLGDSVLNFLVSKYLYSKFPFSSEGELSKMKSIIISQQFLVKFASEITLEDYLILGKSVNFNKGRGKFSILTDSLEACLGAVYIDGGIHHCQKIVFGFIENNKIDTLIKNQIIDYKTFLQELTQKQFQCLPSYKTVKEEGLEHQKMFYIEVHIGGFLYGTGSGKNKKEAAQNAAYHALEKLGAFKKGYNIVS